MALRRHAAALRPAELPLSREIPRGFLRYMEPDDYEAYARRFRAAFAGAIASTGPEVARAEAVAALGRLAAGGAGVAPRPLLHDAAGDFSRRFLVGALLDDDVERLAGWVEDVAFATAIGTPTARASAALAAFGETLARRAAGRPDAGGESVTGHLLREDPRALDDETVRGNLFLLYTASRDSIGSLLAWALYRLSDAPDWVERLRATPRSDAPASAAEPRPGTGDPFTWTILETLRLGQSEYVYRRVLEPIEVEGFRVPRGWILRVCVAESHLLDPPFAEPERFDPGRFERGRFGPEAYAPFGLDRHACLGARMSMLLGRTFAEELVHGFDWTVVETGPPERGNRHWNHWAPSGRFRVALVPRGVSADARAPAGSSSR
ncbi:MAG: cytochrome P450 [Thermoleophilia bacterium]